MALLALDLGTKTGFALHTQGATVSGTMDFKPKRFEGGGMRGLRFRKWLDELHSATKIEQVAFEEVRQGRAADNGASQIYGGLMMMLTAWCEDKKIPYEGVPVGTIKKFATGNGNAKKDAVIASVREKWGFNPKDDNEADALALLHYKLYEVFE